MSYTADSDPGARTRGPQRNAETAMPELETALNALRDALDPNEILSALQAIGLDSRDLAEGTGVNERTTRRWLDGNRPTRNHGKIIGELRVLAIHILQRRGLSVDRVARWLRLPDSELRFQTPLAAVADGRLNNVIVAFDEYVSPRPGSALRDISDSETENVRPTNEENGEPEGTDQPTGEIPAVSIN
jgi:hypothetical protein